MIICHFTGVVNDSAVCSLWEQDNNNNNNKKKDQVMSGLVLVAEKDLNIWQSCAKRVDKRFWSVRAGNNSCTHVVRRCWDVVVRCKFINSFVLFVFFNRDNAFEDQRYSEINFGRPFLSLGFVCRHGSRSVKSCTLGLKYSTETPKATSVCVSEHPTVAAVCFRLLQETGVVGIPHPAVLPRPAFWREWKKITIVSPVHFVFWHSAI